MVDLGLTNYAYFQDVLLSRAHQPYDLVVTMILAIRNVISQKTNRNDVPKLKTWELIGVGWLKMLSKRHNRRPTGHSERKKEEYVVFLAWSVSIATTSGATVFTTANTVSMISYITVPVLIISTIVARPVWWPIS